MRNKNIVHVLTGGLTIQIKRKKIIIALILSSIIIATAAGVVLFQQFSTPIPAVPSGFTATELSSTRINLTWVKAKNADTTYIERNNVSSWRRGEGTPIYNDTGKHYLDTVPHHSQYYYQAWSWNQTEHTYSDKSAIVNTSAVANQPPVFKSQSPVNGTMDTPLRFSWSISISDPEGNPFSWTIQCSNRQTTGGANAANGTKTLLLADLSNATSYKVWVNATDLSGSGLFTRGWYVFTTASNQTTNNRPPVFGVPSPVNVSTGNLLSLLWSIPISDAEGDAYAWTIQCSNRQVTGGTSQTNGTKTLTLSGLRSATTYKVWVNATDRIGSGPYTRRWYTFTTKTTQTNNTPPLFGTPSPTNGSTGNPLSLTWIIPISDPNGDTFNWTIQCNGQTTSATGVSNGTKTLTLTGLSNTTSYKVWVNATDATGSGLFTRRWYTFTTKANQTTHNPPVFGTPTPANGSTGNPLSLIWSIPINDPEGNPFSWTIQCNNGQTNSGNNAANGTKTLTLTGLLNATSYKVWVNATDPDDSGLFTRKWYTFTTKTNLPPGFGSSTPTNQSINILLNITWSIPISDPEGNLFTWTIQCSNGQSNSSTNATNGTKSLSLTGLAYSTSYTIRVNATDPTGSGLFTRRWYTFTTKTNLPPAFGTPSPANSTTNNPLNLTWGIPINDKEGNNFTWSIQCNNSQATNGTDAVNGTKTLSLSDLAYATTYKIWVNATDPTGSNRYTRHWYSFKTQINQPPPPPTITGPAKAKVRAATEYNFTAVDPENDSIYYFIDWGDQTTSGWLGPYPSGEVVNQSHTWSKRGTYTVKAKAKNLNGSESDWGTLDISMPFSFTRPFQPFWERFLERFPHVFPILRHLMGY